MEELQSNITLRITMGTMFMDIRILTHVSRNLVHMVGESKDHTVTWPQMDILSIMTTMLMLMDSVAA